MELLWEYALPQDDHLDQTDLEAPILARSDRVWIATWRYEYSVADRAASSERRGKVLRLHAVDLRSGSAEQVELAVRELKLPAEWTFLDQTYLHCGPLVRLDPEPHLVPSVPFLDALTPTQNAGRLDQVIIDGRFIVSDWRDNAIHCFDFVTGDPVWSRQFDPDAMRPYRVGEVVTSSGVPCAHAVGGLHLLDARTGETRGVIALPRKDVLYSPQRFDGDELYGYTNWSVGGVVRCDPGRRVKWQYRLRFEGPAWYRRTWLIDDVVVWVKGSTELVGVDATTGDERWRFGGGAHLSGRVAVSSSGDLITSTSGRDGALHLLSATSGHPRWTARVAGACKYRAVHKGTVIAGDYDGRVLQIDLTTGEIVDQLNIGSAVVGDVHVANETVYTVAWPIDDHPPRLVAIALDA